MAAKSKGSKGSNGSRPGEAAKADSVTLKVTLPREVARLLRIEAFGRDCSLGQVVADLVRSAPKRFSLVDRGKGAVGTEGQQAPGQEGVQRPQGPPGNLGLHREGAA